MPSIPQGVAALDALMRNANPADFANEEDDDADTGDDKPQFNRQILRSNLGIYGGHFRKLIRSGTQFVASFDDLEEGKRVGKQIFDNMAGGLFEPLWDHRIVPGAECVREALRVSKAAAAEIAATEGDVAKRYELLKAFGADANDDERDFTAINLWRPSKIMLLLGVLGNTPIQEQLTAEVNQGVFDQHIARDLIWFVDTAEPADTSQNRVRQLQRFLLAFTGTGEEGKAELYERLATRLEHWPADQFEAVRDGRQTLRNQMDINVGKAASWAKDNNFLGAADAQDAFERSLYGLIGEFLKRIEPVGPNKAQVIKLRAELRAKRPRVSRQLAVKAPRAAKKEPAAEVINEPLTLVTCNLNDHTQVDGVDGLIEHFLQRTAQGDQTIRQDLNRMVGFMARTDLPPTQRRGVKPILGAKVCFGEDNKLWDFFEFKPTEAAGLSLRSNAAKNSRVYFIKLNQTTLGVFGIEPRSEQEGFLRRIRVKTKNREY